MGSKPQMPGSPSTYAPPAPPTAANAAAVQASADAKQRANEKQGLTSTLLQGGEQGDPSSLGGSVFNQPGGQQKNTLLGGG